MGDPASPFGFTFGHNGGGPGYSVSAFHARDLGGATVCAMASTEDGAGAVSSATSVFRALTARR